MLIMHSIQMTQYTWRRTTCVGKNARHGKHETLNQCWLNVSCLQGESHCRVDYVLLIIPGHLRSILGRILKHSPNWTLTRTKDHLSLPSEWVSQWILLYVALCTIMAISRQKAAWSRNYCPTLIEWLQGFFKVHSTINTTSHSHSRPLSSLEHCICTTLMSNIRPGRDSNPVHLSFKPQPDRMSHRGWPIAKRTQDSHHRLVQCWASVADGGPTLDRHWVNVCCLLNSCHIVRFTLTWLNSSTRVKEFRGFLSQPSTNLTFCTYNT